MRFAHSYNRDMRYVSNFARKHYGSQKYTTRRTSDLLDKYILSRQALPLAECGNHIGNDKKSEYKPWKATQG